MLRLSRGFGLMITVLGLVFGLSGSIGANFGYGNVYWLDEQTDRWVQDTDGTKAVLEKTGREDDFQGNVSVSSSFVSTAIIESQNHSQHVPPLNLRAASLPLTNFYEYVAFNGIFSIKVTALPFDNPQMDNIVWDPINQSFSLGYVGILAKWQFAYKITNNLNEVMNIIEVKDQFGPELTIESWVIQTPLGDDSNGALQVDTGGNYASFRFENLQLKPEQTAEIIFTIVTKEDYVHQQRYPHGLYEMNSGGVLTYRFEGMPDKAQVSVDGWQFRVRILDQSAMSAHYEISAASINWYIYRPGDFFAKAFDGTVRVLGEANQDVRVVVTFSDFDHLSLEGHEAIPVFYSLGKTPDHRNWIRPQELNDTILELEASTTYNASFSLWQRVVLDTHSVGTYQNTGVITFTLVNNRIHYVQN